MKYSIEQLVDQVNTILFQSESKEDKDGRVSHSLSVRRVRDYQSKGLLREPDKVGRNTYYDEDHVQQLVALRTMQSTGLTDSFMKNLSTSSPLYYQSAEVQEQVSSQLGSSYISSLNDSKVSAPDSMKLNALKALNNCAVDSTAISKPIGASMSHRSINAVIGSNISKEISAPSFLPDLKGIPEPIKNIGSKIDINESMFNQNFIVDPEKEKRHQQANEERLRTPTYTNVYCVHERVNLSIKTPYQITQEDKSKIIARLTDIINSI